MTEKGRLRVCGAEGVNGRGRARGLNIIPNSAVLSAEP